MSENSVRVTFNPSKVFHFAAVITPFFHRNNLNGRENCEMPITKFIITDNPIYRATLNSDHV
jgi:hypothetical protein